MRIALIFLLALFASPLYAQGIISYEPGNQPPADTWGPIQTPQVTPPAPLVIPPIDVQMDPVGNAPFFQRAHNGRYTYGGGTGARIIYQHLPNGSAIVSVLLPDGRWAEAFGLVANRSQVLLDLYVGSDVVGELKLATVATLGSPAPKYGSDYLASIMVGNDTAKAGTPCGRLIGRARLAAELVFPFDPNLNCSAGPGIPGRFCLVQSFPEKVGEFGPETCDLSR